jgi:hypothetical protein
VYFTIPTLNTRETALVIWAAVALCWMFSKPNIRRSIFQIFKTLADSRSLVTVFLAAALYEGLAALIVWRLGYWHPILAKQAVLWYFGTALAALGDFKGSASGYLRRIIFGSFGIAVIVEFVASLSTFPTLLELALVPIFFLLAGLLAVSGLYPQYAQVKSFVSCLVILFGLSVLSSSIVLTIHHAAEVVTPQTIEEFAFPITLAVWFVPFFYVNRLFTVMQQNLLWVKFRMMENEALYQYARRIIVAHCGLSTERAAFFSMSFPDRFWNVTDKAGVDCVIREFDAEWRARKPR